MANLTSPGIEVKEIDVTGVVTGASATIGAYVGRFNWGPIGSVELVSDEKELAALHGEPKAVFTSSAAEGNSVATSFMTAASYLAYSDALRVSRVANTNDAVAANNAKNGVGDLSTSGTPTGILVKNVDDFEAKDALASFASYFLIAKYAGVFGNSIKFSACFTADQYKSTSAIANGESDWSLDKNSGGKKVLFGSESDVTDYFAIGDFVEFEYAGNTYKNKVVGFTDDSTGLILSDIGSNLPRFVGGATSGVVTNIKKIWEFANSVNGAPGTNEFHLVLVDADGAITGEAGTILEVHDFLSVDFGKKNADGTTAYWRTVLNDQSQYVWACGASLTSALSSTSGVTVTKKLVAGSNGTEPTQDDYLEAIDLFLDKENVDVSVFICPPLMDSLDDSTVPNYLVQNLAEVRKDVVAYISPKNSDVVNQPGQERANVIAFRNTLPSTSYGFLDSGWKYMYDRYNNVFRWVPLSGDTAGTAARTDDDLDAWWSHAGLNRGGIKNCVRLAWNPNQSQRDDLYQANINPVVTQNGVGHILYGDKTLLSRPSAFDRINVRRLFIVLEKAISNAAKYSLFEFNDEITRQRFVSMVEPFLRDVKSRRGITDFKVICDTSNNTPQVINTNRFVGSVLVRPNYSINYITLNFVAVPNGITFETVAGQI
jgi:hypothetical protein